MQTAPLFRFEWSAEAAQHNQQVLAAHDYDLGKAIVGRRPLSNNNNNQHNNNNTTSRETSQIQLHQQQQHHNTNNNNTHNFQHQQQQQLRSSLTDISCRSLQTLGGRGFESCWTVNEGRGFESSRCRSAGNHCSYQTLREVPRNNNGASPTTGAPSDAFLCYSRRQVQEFSSGVPFQVGPGPGYPTIPADTSPGSRPYNLLSQLELCGPR